MDLILVILVLVLNFSQLSVSVLFNLGYGHIVSIDELLIVFLLFIYLGLFVLHLFLVLLLGEQDLILVVLLNLLDGGKEVLVFTLFLCLKLGKFFSVVEHSSRILVPFLLDFVLLSVEKFTALYLLGVLRLLDLAK